MPVRSAATPPPVRSTRMAGALPKSSTVAPSSTASPQPSVQSTFSSPVQAVPRRPPPVSTSSSSSSSSPVSVYSVASTAPAQPSPASSPVCASLSSTPPASFAPIAAARSVTDSPPVSTSPLTPPTTLAPGAAAQAASGPAAASSSTPPGSFAPIPSVPASQPVQSKSVPQSPVTRPSPMCIAALHHSISSPLPVGTLTPPLPPLPPCFCSTCVALRTARDTWAMPHSPLLPEQPEPPAVTFPPARACSFPPSSAASEPACQGQTGRSGDCPRQPASCGRQCAGHFTSGTGPSRTAYETHQRQPGMSQCHEQCGNARCPFSRSVSQPVCSEPCRTCGGRAERVDSLQSLVSELSMSTEGQPRTSSPVCGRPGRSNQHHQCQHLDPGQRGLNSMPFDPSFNYATHPAARAYNIANCMSSAYGSHLSSGNPLASSHPAAHFFKGRGPAGYATVPPMTLSRHGWTQSRVQTTAEGGSSHHNTASSRGSHCQEERGRERSHSNPHCPGCSSSSCSHQLSWDSDSNGTASTECRHCQGHHGNIPCLMSLPPVRDFLLKRFLEEVISLQTFFSASSGPSPFHLPSLLPPISPGAMFPQVSFPVPPFAPHFPFSPQPSPLMYPAPLRGAGPVMFYALGRFLANILMEESNHQTQCDFQHPPQTFGQRLDTYNILMAKLKGARTGQESWKAFMDLLSFQARCIREQRGSVGGPAPQLLNLQEAERDPCRLPLQPGLSEDVNEDFRLFCMVGQIVLSPPLY